MNCDKCGGEIGITDEVYDIPIYKEDMPESEQIDTKHICLNCFDELETLAIGF